MKEHEHKYIAGPIGDECDFCGLLKSTIEKLEGKKNKSLRLLNEMTTTELQDWENIIDAFEQNFPTKEQVIVFVPVDINGWDFTRYFEEKLIELLVSCKKQWVKEMEKKLMQHFDSLENADLDTSTEQWKNYKFIRNNIRDVLNSVEKELIK